MSLENEISAALRQMQDADYRDFQLRLLPTVAPEAVIGVRTPELRAYAKALLKRGGVEEFLHALPHRCFDENQLHAFLLSEMKAYAPCIAEVERFLPYIDNWATCDQLSPRVFKKHRAELLVSIQRWLSSSETYTLRFAVGMLMQHYLDEAFDPAFPALVAGIRSEAYYVNMMRAWYFATALAKQWEAALPFLAQRRLDTWTHNKAIQKALESSRVSAEQKAFLRSLKIKALPAGQEEGA